MAVSVIILTILIAPITLAQPYGTGLYSQVQYGDETSLSIATDGNVSIPNITPTTGGVLGTGTSNVTVTSTDVKGFKLYVRSVGNTNMVSGGNVIATSANGAPAALSVNTWGYNTDASANFVGMTLTDVLIKSITAPASTGNVTTFTYGMRVSLSKPSGAYATSIIYTAVPQTD